MTTDDQPTPAIDPEQHALMERVSFGIMELAKQNRTEGNDGALLFAIILGAAGAIEALRDPSQSHKSRVTLAIKVGTALQDQIIALGDVCVGDDGGDPDQE